MEMGKDKLKRFSQLKSFSNVIQPKINYSDKDHLVKGAWSNIFKNKNPIVLELGCGAGEYTIGLAKLFPNNNFVGVDIKGARIWKGAKIALEENLNNVQFLRSKIDYIDKFFGKNEIHEIWLTFSDPQPKKPRKRLTSSLFINRYCSFLKKNGVIHLKTDSDLLYHFTKEEIEQKKYITLKDIENINSYIDNEIDSLSEILKIRTFYEQKWIELGKSIKYLAFQPSEKNS